MSDSELCFPMWVLGECLLPSNAQASVFTTITATVSKWDGIKRWSVHIFKTLQYSAC